MRPAERPFSQNDPNTSQKCEEIGAGWPPLLRLERRLLMPLYRLPDTGMLGLTPLRTHILVCGFPRSGTTLLQLMLENSLPHARRFGREIGGWRAATYAWRNHPIVISKVPHDLFRLDALRNFYGPRRAALRIILMLRDPRDVLTSQRTNGGPVGYCVSCERWRTFYDAFVRERAAGDCLVVRYEDLVNNPDRQQCRIEQFTGETMQVHFSVFHAIHRPDFRTETLNGLRPVETSLVARWHRDEHRRRIRNILRELREFPQALIDLGYEPNTTWVEDWRGSAATEPAAAEH